MADLTKLFPDEIISLIIDELCPCEWPLTAAVCQRWSRFVSARRTKEVGVMLEQNMNTSIGPTGLSTFQWSIFAECIRPNLCRPLHARAITYRIISLVEMTNDAWALIQRIVHLLSHANKNPIVLAAMLDAVIKYADENGHIQEAKQFKLDNKKPIGGIFVHALLKELAVGKGAAAYSISKAVNAIKNPSGEKVTNIIKKVSYKNINGHRDCHNDGPTSLVETMNARARDVILVLLAIIMPPAEFSPAFLELIDEVHWNFSRAWIKRRWL